MSDRKFALVSEARWPQVPEPTPVVNETFDGAPPAQLHDDTVVVVVLVVVVVAVVPVVLVVLVLVVVAVVPVVLVVLVVVDVPVVPVVLVVLVVVDVPVVPVVLVVLVVVVVAVGSVLVVVATVLVVEATVLVVVPPPPPHSPLAHASQQLGCVPTQALPPFGAVHASGPFTTLHFVVPLASVSQQVTKPGLPHVELDAQFMTVLAQSSGSVPSFTAALVAWATQLT